MIKLPVTILVNAGPGYSTHNLARQLSEHLTARGVEVQIAGKSNALFGDCSKRHLISLHTDAVWPSYKYARYGHPASVMHIQAIGPKVYPEHEYVAYLSTLAKPKFSGIPVSHISVSPSTDDETLERVRKWFAPSVGRAILSNVHSIHYGIEEGFTIHAPASPYNLVVPYNRWEPGQKNHAGHMKASLAYKIMLESAGSPYQQTFYYHIDAFNPHKDVPKEALDVYSFAPQFDDRAAFKANIGKSGMFLCTSVRESFGLYYLELLMAGVVGVFQDYAWIRKLLPEYPYIAKEADLVPMMLWVRDNFGVARSRILEAVHPVIRERYGQARYLDGITSELARLESMVPA